MECLDVSAEYNEQLSKAAAAGVDKAPPVPLQMQAYNCESTDDYFLETIKRIRAR